MFRVRMVLGKRSLQRRKHPEFRHSKERLGKVETQETSHAGLEHPGILIKL